MKLKIIIAVIFLAGILGFTSITTWNADALKSTIRFNISGPFGTVHGSFSGLKTTILFNENDLASSSIAASIEAKTVSTGVGLRNSDLRKKEEWLNADKYPLISFHSRKIEKTSAGYKASGDLAMKGVSRPIEILFTFSAKENSGLFKGQFKIRRHDYDLGKEGGSVGSTMTIMLQVPVKK